MQFEVQRSIRLEMQRAEEAHAEKVRQVLLPTTRTRPGGGAEAPAPFVPAPRPDEAARQAAVDDLDLDGTPAEECFDEIVAMASRICGTPVAMFNVLSNERQWLKSAVGISVREAPRNDTFCGHTILGTASLVVEDASSDARFAGMAAVTGDMHVRFYAGVPVAAPSGHHVGTLCVFADHVRTLSADQQLSLEVLARQIEMQLFLRQALRTQLTLAKDKQELINLIVHDLKSPLASIEPNAAFIREIVVDEDARAAALDISDAAYRLQRMVLDVLDTSSNSGSGLKPQRGSVDVRQLLGAVKTGIGARAAIELDLADDLVVDGDSDLLHRVLDNLVENAIKYGDNTPVRITAVAVDGAVEIAVRDLGKGIAPIDRLRVFASGHRLEGTSADSARTSRGLGLRFCALAVEAHGGRIWVQDNTPRGSAFCFTVPTPIPMSP